VVSKGAAIGRSFRDSLAQALGGRNLPLVDLTGCFVGTTETPSKDTDLTVMGGSLIGGKGQRTMGPDENVAIMRRAYDAFNTGDLGTLTELFDESAVWHLPGRSPMADDYQSRDATLAYFGQLAQETGGTFRAELSHLTADGDDRVVGIQRSTADRNGKHLDVSDCIVFQLKDGRVTDGREHFEDLYAWDAFWA